MDDLGGPPLFLETPICLVMYVFQKIPPHPRVDLVIDTLQKNETLDAWLKKNCSKKTIRSK